MLERRNSHRTFAAERRKRAVSLFPLLPVLPAHMCAMLSAICRTTRVVVEVGSFSRFSLLATVRELQMGRASVPPSLSVRIVVSFGMAVFGWRRIGWCMRDCRCAYPRWGVVGKYHAGKVEWLLFFFMLWVRVKCRRFDDGDWI